jgi:ATP-dependent exoDNAse (exonuclease V) beta subunit
VHRLPRDFNPLARFTSAANHRLPYTPAVALPNAPSFDRPEGSFAVRAFGNVVHRFLQLASADLEGGQNTEAMAANLASWEPRISAALRNEGLSTAAATRETPRALDALRKTLQDPVGKWILSGHARSTSEYSIASAGSSVLRADRTFLAGSAPLSQSEDRMWIIDFKTTEQGSRSSQRFEQDELLKYREQLERYAKVLMDLTPELAHVMLGLYYPLIPRLLHWTF